MLRRVTLCSLRNFSFSRRSNSFFFSSFSILSNYSFFYAIKWSLSRFHLALSFSCSNIIWLRLDSASLYFCSISSVFWSKYVFSDDIPCWYSKALVSRSWRSYSISWVRRLSFSMKSDNFFSVRSCWPVLPCWSSNIRSFICFISLSLRRRRSSKSWADL